MKQSQPRQWRKSEWAIHAPSDLAKSLDNIELKNNNPPTLAKAVEEAQYVIDLFYEPYGQPTSKEEKQVMRQTIKDCKAFIRRYKRRAGRLRENSNDR